MTGLGLLAGPEPPDADFVLNALLRYNYLPMQKRHREELPPIFSSTMFSPAVAVLLNGEKPRGHGYDTVDYRLTRFNGIPRVLSIPHPLAYAQLSWCISAHWNDLQSVASSGVSRVVPQRHDDGRLVIMDYEMGIDKNCRKTETSIGARYMVCTDIANFFPSIYSHAIGWVLLTPKIAKACTLIDEAHWPNVLDLKLRQCKRCETQGVAIGPATSNIITELLLDDVDKAMANRGSWIFERFVDDYTAYCATEDQANDFIRYLSEELSRYNLVLNAKKTSVVALPCSFAPAWTTRLAGLPPAMTGLVENVLDRFKAIEYLDLAMSMAKEEPDESVLKYALKTLFSHQLSPQAQSDVLPYALGLCFHQPALLPTLGRLLTQMSSAALLPYQERLNALVQDNAQSRRSDGMCWALYYMIQREVPIDSKTAEAVITSGDCLSLLLLYLSGAKEYQDTVVQFVSRIGADMYDLDRYWLLLYQLFRDGKTQSPYSNEKAFEILREQHVTFVDETATIEQAFRQIPFESETELS
jgi:hypothetical protein